MFEEKEQELINLANELKQEIKDNVINALTSNLTDSSLSANQGRLLNEKIESFNEVELYNNPSSQITDRIALSTNVSDFKYIEIFYGLNSSSGYSSVKVYQPNNKRVSLTLNLPGQPIVIYTGIVRISENFINFITGGAIALVSTQSGQTVTNNGVASSNELRIYRVVGYY